MSATKKRPFITVKEAIIASAVLLFTAIAFEKVDVEPEIPLKNVLEAEVTSFNQQVKNILIAEIASKVESPDGKATMLVVYASWCGYCKVLIPEILEMKSAGKMDTINLLFVSIDKKKEKLSRYILERGYDTVFEPYILPEESLEGFDSMLMGKGIRYRGVVPYSVIFDGKGRVITEISGMLRKGQLEAIIEKVSAMPPRF